MTPPRGTEIVDYILETGPVEVPRGVLGLLGETKRKNFKQRTSNRRLKTQKKGGSKTISGRVSLTSLFTKLWNT